jgi:hypothetical protein
MQIRHQGDCYALKHKCFAISILFFATFAAAIADQEDEPTLNTLYSITIGDSIPYVQRRFSGTLTEDNFRILYYFHPKTASRQRLQFNKGVFVFR